MVDDRARKKKIRAHMAATGLRYLQAARDIDGSGHSYMRTAWSNSAWPRLMPQEAMNLEVVIDTASVLSQDGDLAHLVTTHPASNQFPNGINTVLTWQDNDDDGETAMLRRHAEAAFTAAVTALARPVPTTVADLADLLADIGVFEHTHTENGTEQWRAPLEIPDPMDALPLPADWIDREERIGWRTRTAGPAMALRRSLRAYEGRPQVDTTLQRLAGEADMPVSAVRAGLDGLMYRFGVSVLRQGTTLDRRDLDALAEHARIGIVVDWTSFTSTTEPDEGSRDLLPIRSTERNRCRESDGDRASTRDS
ncbi:DUF6042 family protein [Nocardia sp. NRRL S-836]|uniref:DUF6042 family protein n=1 Tax=Nocardia sp. NRRL S-836 TaxID=1519492 RepID=UPI0006C3B24A|nr:DUF6042 family protein [Nocardia sp. NRRL S-836]KOV84613.1 hypothetical protein ADL03_15045 [Nocardia sp. NRRL S-836]